MNKKLLLISLLVCSSMSLQSKEVDYTVADRTITGPLQGTLLVRMNVVATPCNLVTTTSSETVTSLLFSGCGNPLTPSRSKLPVIMMKKIYSEQNDTAFLYSSTLFNTGIYDGNNTVNLTKWNDENVEIEIKYQ